MPDRVIVAGFDGSESNAAALAFASDLATKYDAIVHLVHVIDWSPLDLSTLEEHSVRAEEMKQEIQADRESLFPPALAQFEQAGVGAEAFTVYGDPVDALVSHAEDCEALAIVVGRRGGSTLKRMLLGSVARGLVNVAHGPVVVVP